MLVPLMAEPIGKVLPEDPFLSAAVYRIPQIPDRAEVRPEITQLTFLLQEDSPAGQAIDGASPDSSLGEELPLIASGAIDRNLGNSVELAIALLMALVLLRDYFLGRRDCLEYQQLREHLVITARCLDEARGRYLMAAYNRVTGAEGELAVRERELDLLRKALSARNRVRQSHPRESEQLEEHLVLAGRNLEAARARWFAAARPVGLSPGEPDHEAAAGEPMEFVRREQEVEALQNALVVWNCRGNWQDRDTGDLREHMALARRHLEIARAEWLMKAYHRAVQESAEVAALEETVNLLKAKIEGHCRIHGCRPAHAPAHSLAGAPA
jgi:hypothetical protein